MEVFELLLAAVEAAVAAVVLAWAADCCPAVRVGEAFLLNKDCLAST